jgi:hypothetical protein
MRRTDRTVGTVEVDGTTVTLNLVMRGSGTNVGIEPENFHVNIVGDVKDPPERRITPPISPP